ncbi:unnamed protein product [Haemonchus placei]|uniref:Neur_chan_LBD domain-containing protein n=1 Tax=Haemonchus placei TaxID=6290 RepID=A0A0N4WSP6_HAEPC|nr:unnamed protein product [Haemonchus placei]
MSEAHLPVRVAFFHFSLNFNDVVKLQSNNDIRVNHTGHVRYYIPFSSESLCKLDVKFFPFDTQQCTLLFGSWAHSNDSIKYSLYSPKLSLIDFYDNQEWELDTVRSSVKSNGFLYDYLDPPLFWEMIIIDLVVERQSFYYVFNLVIPSTIITLVAVIGFHTPSTSGRMRDAKFRLGIMTLMSMSVILLAIVEDMPKFSMSANRKGRGSFSGIPLIGLYYFILLAIIGLSTVTTSMFVFLERDVRVKHDIPWYLEWLSFDVQRRRMGRFVNSFVAFKTHSAIHPPIHPLVACSQWIPKSRSSSASHVSMLLNARQTCTSSRSPVARQSMEAPYDDIRIASKVACIFPTQLNKCCLQEHLLSNGHVRTGLQGKARGVAVSLLSLIPRATANNTYQLDIPPPPNSQVLMTFCKNTNNEPLTQETTPPRQNLRRRLSVTQYDNMVLYQYFEQVLEDIISCAARIEKNVGGIRQEVAKLKPLDDLNSKWQTVIRRLEIISLIFYVSVLFITMYLFFYHEWYCAVGHNPCGQMNLKCPWMAVTPDDPQCEHNSYN